jgi:hypothetical protein
MLLLVERGFGKASRLQKPDPPALRKDTGIAFLNQGEIVSPAFGMMTGRAGTGVVRRAFIFDNYLYEHNHAKRRRPPATGELDYTTSCALPTPWAQFTLHAFVEHATGKEHLAMVLGDVGNGEPVLARVHSECLTGDVLFSQRCDCGAQLEAP